MGTSAGGAGDAAEVERLVALVRGDALDLGAWAEGLSRREAASLETRLATELLGLPVPIGPLTGGAVVERRRALERLLGWLRARRGDHALLLEAERAVWLAGGSHLRYLRVLVRGSLRSQAATLARSLLARDELPERGEIQRFVQDVSCPPGGWQDAVVAFAASPSEEGWARLWRFTPTELLFERRRHTLDLLRRLGAAPALVFSCAAWDGVTAEAVALVVEGVVAPRIVEAHAHAAPQPRQAGLLGLAARAACLWGDRLGTVRLLLLAGDVSADGVPPPDDLDFVREHADPELQGMLVGAGLG